MQGQDMFLGQSYSVSPIENEGRSYPYRPFLYRGATRNRTGDNLQAELLMANNQIAMDVVMDALRGRWLVYMVVAAMRPDAPSVARVLSRETWVIAAPTYDASTITVVLSSAIDAVGATVPARVLTEPLVGALPVTGSIRNL